MAAAGARVKTETVKAPQGHDVRMLTLDRSDNMAPNGQFFVRRNFVAMLNKDADPRVALPRSFGSFADAKAWIEKKTKRKLEFARISTAGTNDMPTGWFASAGRDTYEIAYAGSIRYPDGRPVDPMLVGTPDEVRHASVN